MKYHFIYLSLLFFLFISCSNKDKNIITNTMDDMKQDSIINNQDREEKDIAEEPEKEPEKIASYFTDLESIDKSNYPNLPMRIFGIEVPYDIPNTKESVIVYDDMNSVMIVMNTAVPRNTIKVEAVDPLGKRYHKVLSLDKHEFYSYNSDDFGNTYEKPYLVFIFDNLSAFNNGKWKISVVIDTEPDTLIESEIYITMASISITPISEPNPFDYDSDGHYDVNDKIYFFGNNQEPNAIIDLVLYNITSEYNENNENRLIPVIGTKLKVDDNGRFKAVFNVGNDIPKGQYKIAYGKEIKEIVLFGVWFYID